MQVLKDRVALVTGGASGIGRATAVRFARAAARVAVLDLKREDVEKVTRRIERDGEALGIAADITDADAMTAAVRQIEERWGRLDIVFANAGINGVWAPVEELTLDEWRKTIDVNLTGSFITLQVSIPLLKRRGGSVIITSSVNGTRIFSNAGATAYSCTKAGLLAMGKMTALELAKHRIRVNVICPGAITTAIDESTEKRDIEEAEEPVEFPEGRIPLTDGKPGSSQQVAELVLFLASDASNHITGTELWIDGGESLLQG
ncbi:MAG: SDR family oxidoreductase [Planctomycetaceae bacterium]